jgi:hypothetical protein
MGGAAALTELKLLVGVALALLVAGFVIAALAALDHQPGRPLLTASVRTKPRSELTVTVRRDGLGSGDEMEVFVEGRIYYTKKNNVSDTATRPPSVLYRASFGPNQDGKVDLSFSVPLPQKPRYTAVLVQTWVPFHFPTNKPEQTVGCGPQALNGPKYAAACVLATLPTARG